jgi:hypothetical protein
MARVLNFPAKASMLTFVTSIIFQSILLTSIKPSPSSPGGKPLRSTRRKEEITLMKNVSMASLLAASLMMTGCTMADLALVPSATKTPAARGQLVLTPQFVNGGYATAAVVNPHTIASIHHLVVRLFILEDGDEIPATNSAGNPIQMDIVRAELGNPITLAPLRANTTYRVRASAYKAAGTLEADLISTTDEGSFVDVNVTNNDQPISANLKVTLTDVHFAGAATSNGVSVINGGYAQVAPESIFVGTTGNLMTRTSTASIANTTGGYLELVRIGNQVYVFGGFDSNTLVMGAEVQPDGSLSTFTSAGVNISSPRRGYRTAVIGNFLYLFGGHDPDANANVNTIERAPINANGTLGAFETVATQLPTTLSSFGVFVGGGKVHVFGGTTMSSTQTKAAFTAPIHPDGSIGEFIATPQLDLPQASSAFATVRANNRLYVVGGEHGLRNSVHSAPILPDGSLGTFADTGVTLATGRGTLSAAFIGGKIYAVGGFTTSTPINTIEAATVNPDGSLGAFSVVEGVTLIADEWGHESVIAGNSLYVFANTDIQRFPIQ